jgi:hypothetical protein
MSVATSNFPMVRTVTQLVRSLLADEAIAPGYPFVPLSLQVAAGIVTATFASPPGFIVGDTLLVSNFTPSSLNGTYQIGSGAGNQFLWQNSGATGPATVIGTIQGYGTGKKYTDTVLMPFVNSAYRGLQRALKTTGSTEFREGESFVTIPGITFADSSAQVFLNFEGVSIGSDANPPPTFIDSLPLGQLPADLLMPRKLWERPTGSSDNFNRMVDLTNTGGLPSRPQGSVLNCFEWQGDALVFLGATQDNDIKIEYDKGIAAVSDGGSQLFVLNSEDYHAYAVCALVEPGRGGKDAQTWDAASEDAKEKLVNAFTRGQQFKSVRSRGFSSRRGYGRRYY